MCKYDNFGAAQDCGGCFLPRPVAAKKMRPADGEEKKPVVDLSDLAEMCEDLMQGI